jgi:hypothetical protein
MESSAVVAGPPLPLPPAQGSISTDGDNMKIGLGPKQVRLSPLPGNLCRSFAVLGTCDGGHFCSGEHTLMEDRVTCPLWLENPTKGCTRVPCVLPHKLPESRIKVHQGLDLIVQFHSTHETRVLAYLREAPRVGAGGAGSDPAAKEVAEVSAARAHKNRHYDRVALVRLAGDEGEGAESSMPRIARAEAFAARLGNVSWSANALSRWYPVSSSTVCSTRDEAVAICASFVRAEGERMREEAAAASAAAAAGASAPAPASSEPAPAPSRTRVCLRMHCFPHDLEVPAAESIESMGDLGGGIVGLPSMAHWDLLVSIVSIQGRFYVGSLRRSSPAVWGSVAERFKNKDAVCRAQMKLQEVLARAADLFPLPAPYPPPPVVVAAGGQLPARRRFAIDVGASPGGWSRCLAEDAGFEVVFAVDPGLLSEAGGGLPPAIRHMKMRDVDAIKLLLDGEAGEGEAGEGEKGAGALAGLPPSLRGQLTAFTSDMNVPTVLALKCVRQALPLLAPGAWVCITLKNFDGSTKLWHRNVEAARAELEGTVCAEGSTRILHLFANGTEEVTLLGRVR